MRIVLTLLPNIQWAIWITSTVLDYMLLPVIRMWLKPRHLKYRFSVTCSSSRQLIEPILIFPAAVWLLLLVVSRWQFLFHRKVFFRFSPLTHEFDKIGLLLQSLANLLLLGNLIFVFSDYSDLRPDLSVSYSKQFSIWLKNLSDDDLDSWAPP